MLTKLRVNVCVCETAFHVFEVQMHLFSLVVLFRASVHPLRLIRFSDFQIKHGTHNFT
jgi:hypothetical protein